MLITKKNTMKKFEVLKECIESSTDLRFVPNTIVAYISLTRLRCSTFNEIAHGIHIISMQNKLPIEFICVQEKNGEAAYCKYKESDMQRALEIFEDSVVNN